ncbi:MAG TPA: tryptophan--tRNA ligase, partial [Nitrospirae bacterium]|nr:tryptophan--tRNA ligase [Nitrospirota bacterium]
MDRVLSGMQPSGYLHLGNLMGALKNWVSLQDGYDCYYFVADWHALTTNYTNPSIIKEYTYDLVLNFLAAGLDPDKCTIFIQSRILEHAELHILLSMITPLGWLERVPSYKEKKEEIKDRD